MAPTVKTRKPMIQGRRQRYASTTSRECSERKIGLSSLGSDYWQSVPSRALRLRQCRIITGNVRWCWRGTGLWPELQATDQNYTILRVFLLMGQRLCLVDLFAHFIQDFDSDVTNLPDPFERCT